MAGRTEGGSPTATTRKKHGSRDGAYPVWDHKSAMAAIKLRHHGKSMGAAAVLAKVARWASAHSDKVALKAVAAAREADKE